MKFTEADYEKEFVRALTMYTKQLDAMGKMMKPKVKECLIDGFKDGLRWGLRLAVAVSKDGE